jgi:hypothetical protein
MDFRRNDSGGWDVGWVEARNPTYVWTTIVLFVPNFTKQGIADISIYDLPVPILFFKQKKKISYQTIYDMYKNYISVYVALA